MLLPLLERAKEKNAYFLVTPKTGARSGVVPQCGTASAPGAASVPQRAPQPGEQYRFHFDMTKCIGCKCCVVACNEQNGNPPDINWRRVGEIEGGWYPDTQRLHLSMGCNHCIEPTCLTGCPVDAYSKDPLTGVVLHSPEICIGCQYCTWNCSYGVPHYNPERGVVGKCDMCHNRLAEGRSAASLQRGAWNGGKRDPPQHPLGVMPVLTPRAVGTFTTIWLLELFGKATRLSIAAMVSLLVGGLALGASTMPLGRPIHAYRALK